MIRVGVLGGGISGLSFARLAQHEFDIEVLEKNSYPGGIARTRNVNGVAFHTVGGHCFNSRVPEVLSFVFEQVLEGHHWHKKQRSAGVSIDGNVVPYPIEFSVRELFLTDKALAFDILHDYCNLNDDGIYSNLREFFIKKYGPTLAAKYFVPYNEKIWQTPADRISAKWLDGKIPVPGKEELLCALFQNVKDNMPHSDFYYPNSNDQNSFIDSLSEGVRLTPNYAVKRIRQDRLTGKLIVNEEKSYDWIVNTLPLDYLPGIFDESGREMMALSKKLKHVGLTTMLWESRPTGRTWTYFPAPDTLFHRYIHIGNFFQPSSNYTITEAIGPHTSTEMTAEGGKDDFLLSSMDYCTTEYAYVLFDHHHKACTERLIEFLKSHRIYSLGRFGEWQYYNMDMCIKRALDLWKELKDKIVEYEKYRESFT